MATKKKRGKSSNPPHKREVLTKKQLEHEVELSLVRYCRIWRYSVPLALEYLNSEGHKMGETKYRELRNELKEQVLEGAMFTKQALDNLLVEHGDSLELINGMLDVIIKEIRDHSATTIFDEYEEKQVTVSATEKTKEQFIMVKKYRFSKNHNSNIVSKLITTATELMQKRDNTILATPTITALVNELKKGEEE